MVHPLFALALAVPALASGCGRDDGGAEEAAAEAPGCDPVGQGGGRRVSVTLREFSVAPEPGSVAAGEVTFDLRNEGAEPHELVVVRAGSLAELTVVDRRVDEDALPAGAFIGEVQSFAAGENCEGTFELDAGSYVLFCNLVEEEDGEMESHFEEGMAPRSNSREFRGSFRGKTAFVTYADRGRRAEVRPPQRRAPVAQHG